MFEQYACGCIVSPLQGRVRFCGAHRIRWTEEGLRIEANPTGKVVRRYPGNGEEVEGWTGR